MKVTTIDATQFIVVADAGGPTIRPVVTPSEQQLINALRAIVLETMDFAPQRHHDSDSFLPVPLIDAAQAALAQYDAQIARAAA